MKEIPVIHFRKYNFPPVGKKEWYKIVNGSPDINLTIDSEGVVISKWNPPKPKVVSMSAFNGTLYAVDKGEWGGHLNYEVNGTTSLIKEGSISFLFEFADEIYFVDCLHHFSLNYGLLYRLYLENGRLLFELVLDLHESIEAMVIIDEQSIAAVSSENLFLVKNVNSEFKKEILIRDYGLESTYPNSMIYLGSGKYFVGMRGGIGKFCDNPPQVEYYKYFGKEGAISADSLQID